VRDITALSLVRRGAYINCSLRNGNLFISSSVKALQNGKYGDIIKVQQNNGKILRAVVTGKNRVEIR